MIADYLLASGLVLVGKHPIPDWPQLIQLGQS
jgi:hypothetical protein